MSTTHVAQELLMNKPCSGGSVSFARDKSFEEEEPSGRPSEVGNDQLRASSKLILLQLRKKLPKKSNVNHSTVIWHLKQIGKGKNSISECLMS